MHAREWISVSVNQYIIITVFFKTIACLKCAMKFFFQLLKNYETDNATRGYVEKMSWYILPIMNPDGYEFSREKVSL